MTGDIDDGDDDVVDDRGDDGVDAETDGAERAEATGGANADRTCDRCGGEAVPVESGAVTLLECADCGNVLGLVDEEGPVVHEPVEGPTAGDGEGRPVEEVTATDGELGQLVALLRAGDPGRPASTGPGSSIETDRLLIETDRATLEVLVHGDRLLIREADREDDRGGDDRDGAD